MTTKYDIGDRFFVECEIKDVYFRKNGNHRYNVIPIVKDDDPFIGFDVNEDEIQFLVDNPKDNTETKFTKLKRKLAEIGRIILEK